MKYLLAIYAAMIRNREHQAQAYRGLYRHH
jgi:hypothetical protein